MVDETTSELSHMSTLTAAVTAMFAEARDLPDPSHMLAWGIVNGHVHDSVSLHFAPEEASTEAITLWALRFGGVVESHIEDSEYSHHVPELWVRADFTYLEFVRVDAFAHIPLPVKEAIPDAEQDSEPEPATPF